MAEDKSVCKLLSKVMSALYYVYDVCPVGVDCPSYEKLSLEVEDLKKKIGCPKGD